ncbi:hypothetical protein ACFSTH_10405 [Paenibacillus yanchengensis]|uniref:Uncharacterized protein n=1 Tax=Paenibacillus yanchengensis TaxID=2035833 RepID=A0ABW4YNT9_9BACL
MFKKHLIYKTDNYNMLSIEVQGKTIIAREISDQWGEDCHTFLSRPALHDWANRRFNLSDYAHDEELYHSIMNAIKEV